MGFNYAREKRKFDEKWKKLEDWYRESGMSEDAIREMREYDWNELKAKTSVMRAVLTSRKLPNLKPSGKHQAGMAGLRTLTTRLSYISSESSRPTSLRSSRS